MKINTFQKSLFLLSIILLASLPLSQSEKVDIYDWEFSKIDNDYFGVKVTFPDTAYLSIGFSENMTDTDMIVVENLPDQKYTVTDRWSEHPTKPKEDTSYAEQGGKDDIEDIKYENTGGNSCIITFKRKFVTGDKHDYQFDKDETKKIKFAWLPNSPLAKHNKTIASKTIIFDNTKKELTFEGEPSGNDSLVTKYVSMTQLGKSLNLELNTFFMELEEKNINLPDEAIVGPEEDKYTIDVKTVKLEAAYVSHEFTAEEFTKKEPQLVLNTNKPLVNFSVKYHGKYTKEQSPIYSSDVVITFSNGNMITETTYGKDGEDYTVANKITFDTTEYKINLASEEAKPVEAAFVAASKSFMEKNLAKIIEQINALYVEAFDDTEEKNPQKILLDNYDKSYQVILNVNNNVNPKFLENGLLFKKDGTTGETPTPFSKKVDAFEKFDYTKEVGFSFHPFTLSRIYKNAISGFNDNSDVIPGVTYTVDYLGRFLPSVYNTYSRNTKFLITFTVKDVLINQDDFTVDLTLDTIITIENTTIALIYSQHALGEVHAEVNDNGEFNVVESGEQQDLIDISIQHYNGNIDLNELKSFINNVFNHFYPKLTRALADTERADKFAEGYESMTIVDETHVLYGKGL